jgi:hypothetical protein
MVTVWLTSVLTGKAVTHPDTRRLARGEYRHDPGGGQQRLTGPHHPARTR